MFQSLRQHQRIAKWLSASALAAACVAGSPRDASARPVVEVRIAPPAARVEVVPARPSPRHVWAPGYWAWNGRRHVWVQGHNVIERRGYAWREPRWEERSHGHWHFREGGWDRR
jgi:WXXGXW repeat (2 copies)